MYYYTTSGNSRVIYTSYLDFTPKNRDDEVYHYSHLDEERVKWIDEQVERMSYSQKSPAESLFEEKMVHFKWRIERQVFFQINGRGFFLDYYVPKLNIAIEVDSVTYHGRDWQEDKDYWRDVALWEIGIKTVRITYAEVKSGDFRGILEDRIKYALSGKDFRPNMYYLIPSRVKFKRRVSTNRLVLEGAMRVLENPDTEEAIIIATSHIYMIDMASRDRITNYDGANLDILYRIYEAKKGKNVHFFFSGSRESIAGNSSHFSIMRHWDKVCKKLPSDMPVYEIEVKNGEYVINISKKGEYSKNNPYICKG